MLKKLLVHALAITALLGCTAAFAADPDRYLDRGAS